MRKIFIETLCDLARHNPRVLLLTGDLGYSVIEPFADQFPKQFFNMGVAEQNMVGVATGLAEAGFIPFVYSISSFAVLRPYEFIRNGPIVHQAKVRIVGVGGGFDYGPAGVTHYALEDIGVLRMQKGIKVIVPCDSPQTKTALAKTWDLPGPIYYRISKDDMPGLFDGGQFELGKINKIRDGSHGVIVAAGAASKEAVLAAEKLSSSGISLSVVAVSSYNPSPIDDLIPILKKFPKVFTIEDHYTTNGLGSFVSEVIAENGISSQLVRCGVQTMIEGPVGSKTYMNEKFNLSADKLVEIVKKTLKK